MKVYLLYRRGEGEELDETYLVGVYYSIVGAKADAERKDGKLDWVANNEDSKYTTKFYVNRINPVNREVLQYSIQEWELQ